MSDPQRKIALVIGVNGGPDTGLPMLRFAEDTATMVAHTLTAPACGFTLYGDGPILGSAATTETIRRSLFNARRDAGHDGFLVVYYIGHGRYVEISDGISDAFLVPYDFHPDDVRDDPDVYFSMRWLQEKVLRYRSPDRLLLVLDCCFAGAVGEAAPDPLITNLRTRLEDALGIQSTDAGATGAAMRKTLAAVSARLPAYEADGTTGYSAAFLRGLAGAAALTDGSITAQSLYAYFQRQFASVQTGEYGFDRSSGATLAYHPEHALLRTPNHRPWVMPHLHIELVGREGELEHLAVALTSKEPGSAALVPAVAGIGGIGKTRLAIEFAYRYRDEFPDGVFWLDMEQAHTIEAQVATCGGQRGLQLFESDVDQEQNSRDFGVALGDRDNEKEPFERRSRLTLHQQAAQVLTVWESPGRRLIIFDNLEDPVLLERWCPRGVSRILITTRRQSWADNSSVRIIPLEGLSDPASLSLLLEPRALDRSCIPEDLLRDPHEAAAAQQVIRELAGLPLALTLAGGYLARSSLSLVDYLAQLQVESIQHRSLNHEFTEGLPEAQRSSIIAAFALSYEQLGPSTIDKMAKAIWFAAAQLAPDPIDADVLVRVVEHEPANPTQREEVDLALRRLRNLGLIEYTQATYRLHRLLAAYARCISPNLIKNWYLAAQGLAKTILVLDDADDLSGNAQRFRSHVLHLISAKKKGVELEVADLLYAAGCVMYYENSDTLAGEYLTEALEIQTALLGRRHKQTARTLFRLGIVTYYENNYAAARGYLTEALEIQTALLGRRHKQTGQTLSRLGNVAFLEGNSSAAREYLTEVLNIETEILGRHHTDTVWTLSRLGDVAYYENDYVAARGYLTEALEIQTELLGSHHADTAQTLFRLGDVAYYENDYATARGYLTEALKIQTELLGSHHADTAQTRSRLDDVNYYENDYTSVLDIQKELLRHHRKEVVRKYFVYYLTHFFDADLIRVFFIILVLYISVDYRYNTAFIILFILFILGIIYQLGEASSSIRISFKFSIGVLCAKIILIPFINQISVDARILIMIIIGSIGLLLPWPSR